MQVSGYRLKRALRALDRRRSFLQSQWESSLWAFEGEDKPAPETVLEELCQLEEQIARVQAAQAEYNLAVRVTVRGGDREEGVTLLEAVKRVGGVSRLEQMAKKAAIDSTGPFYYGQERSRSKEQEHAERRLSVERAAAYLQEYGDYAEALREAIAAGNEKLVEIEGLDPALFE